MSRPAITRSILALARARPLCPQLQRAGILRQISSSSSVQANTGISDLTSIIQNTLDGASGSGSPFAKVLSIDEPTPIHHLHVLSTKHNTHITLTKPNKDALVSLSTGNIGFRKGQRGEYDAAYQLAAYTMKVIQDKGLLAEIKELELVLRGFGKGREAVTKALMGTEGKHLRGKVVKITDTTRLKFGGTRSPNPRRLG